jgi:hypothetical protein
MVLVLLKDTAFPLTLALSLGERGITFPALRCIVLAV